MTHQSFFNLPKWMEEAVAFLPLHWTVHGKLVWLRFGTTGRQLGVIMPDRSGDGRAWCRKYRRNSKRWTKERMTWVRILGDVGAERKAEGREEVKP